MTCGAAIRLKSWKLIWPKKNAGKLQRRGKRKWHRQPTARPVSERRKWPFDGPSAPVNNLRTKVNMLSSYLAPQ